MEALERYYNEYLLDYSQDANWECYDIEPHSNSIQRDTLFNPPKYKDKWVITNPPYLAKNKAKDKKIYNLYNVDDLYKASMVSMLEANGGILIIPTNYPLILQIMSCNLCVTDLLYK